MLRDIRKLIVNFEDKRYTNKRYAIANEYGCLAIVYANNEQDALDIAADAGALDCQLMERVDYLEYLDNAWDDSYILLGNASEPYWCEYLSITEIGA